MIQVINKRDCCGCTACASVCNHQALVMEKDNLGFLYPKFNPELCVHCGLCEMICQFNDNYSRYDNYELPIVYQFRLKDDSELMKSQSGGAFFTIANVFIEQGGVVYGAAFTESWRVTHQRINIIKDLDKLRMSKYVQSDMRGVYVKVKEDLKNGLFVLFSGTACQVSGLKSFIPKRLHERLYCIDIICHGVPAPQIWDDYIDYLQKRHQSKIERACFRDKKFGWHGATESFRFENGVEEFRRTNNYLYFNGYSLRESCTTCHFTNTKRIGDITLGDQWGIPKDSLYDDEKGMSVIFVNSEKGKSLFSLIPPDNIIENISIHEAMQPQLQTPTKMNPLREKFERDYVEKGFLYVARRYSDMGWRYKMKCFIEQFKSIIKKIIIK